MLQQMGRKGYQNLIREDILLTRHAYNILSNSPNIETNTCNLSITTFRYIPEDLNDRKQLQNVQNYLNELNMGILEKIENSGKFFLSNAVIYDIFLLRMCIVNFRTSITDIEAFPEFFIETGRTIDMKLRSTTML